MLPYLSFVRPKATSPSLPASHSSNTRPQTRFFGGENAEWKTGSGCVGLLLVHLLLSGVKNNCETARRQLLSLFWESQVPVLSPSWGPKNKRVISSRTCQSVKVDHFCPAQLWHVGERCYFYRPLVLQTWKDFCTRWTFCHSCCRFLPLQIIISQSTCLTLHLDKLFSLSGYKNNNG